jgi:ribonuclease T1
MLRPTATLRLALTIALVGLFGFGSTGVHARQSVYHESIGIVSLVELPLEAQQTLRLIQRGGPFPFPDKDGSIFGNFENRLPPQARGYYREYTVPTPGRYDRGARRLIAGSGRRQDVTASGEYYYTADHYRHFRRIIRP